MTREVKYGVPGTLDCMGHEGPKMTFERDPGQSRRMASVDQTEAV